MIFFICSKKNYLFSNERYLFTYYRHPLEDKSERNIFFGFLHMKIIFEISLLLKFTQIIDFHSRFVPNQSNFS